MDKAPTQSISSARSTHAPLEPSHSRNTDTVINLPIQRSKKKAKLKSRHTICTEYNAKKSTTLGAFTIATSIISIMVWVGGLVIQSVRNSDNQNWTFNVGAGMWCPAFFLVAGSFAIAAGEQRTYCTIRSVLAFSILALPYGFVQIGFAIYGILVDTNVWPLDPDKYNDYNYGPLPSTTASAPPYGSDDVTAIASLAMSGCSILLAMVNIAMVIALAGVAGYVLCCHKQKLEASMAVQNVFVTSQPEGSTVDGTVLRPRGKIPPPRPVPPANYQPTTQRYQTLSGITSTDSGDNAYESVKEEPYLTPTPQYPTKEQPYLVLMPDDPDTKTLYNNSGFIPQIPIYDELIADDEEYDIIKL